MRYLCLLLAVISASLVAVPPLAAQVSGVKLVSGGELTDRDGAIHTWKVNGAHTLIWDGQPYIPVGGVFYSRYICLGQTEENWQADVQALELAKGKGISDLLLKTIGPATWTKPEAWQRLLDYLDSSGFTYGIDLADGPKTPLAGYVVEPTRYRMPDITKDSSMSISLPDATAAFWVLCSASDAKIMSTGGTSVADGKIDLKVKAQPGQNGVLLLYPRREISNGGQSGVADLWSGFDEFRDRLLAFVSSLKFGSGLRFFVDPLSSKMDFEGELESLIPDSADFRVEFEAYLAKKYLNIGSLNAAWGLVKTNLSSFQQAARLIPLWRGTRGTSAAYDRASGTTFSINVPLSKMWNDVTEFRDSSAQNYMNTAADLLKRYAANVPVVYRSARYHRIYANSISRGGFDGLGVEAYGHGQDLVTRSAGQVYSLAEEGARTMWFIVTGTQDTPSQEKASPGYPSRNGLVTDLSYLSEIGAKGLFVLGLQVLPEEQWRNHSLALVPDQLDWLREFRDSFASVDRVDQIPKVVYYPAEPIVGASVTRLRPGEWWLPSLRTGVGLSLGDTVGGYTLRGQDGICLWSRKGEQTVSLPLVAGQQPAVAYPTNPDGILTIDKKKVTLKLDEAPLIVTGPDHLQVFPIETVEAEVAKLAPLVARAKAAGKRVPEAESAAKRVRDLLKNGRPAIAYDIARSFVKQISEDLGTYAWVEGEHAISHNFDRVTPALGASAGAYLELASASEPPMSPYSAAYSFVATQDTNHEIWIAGVAEEADAPQISFSIDNGPWQAAVPLQGTYPYGKGLAWFRIGSAALTRGSHVLVLRLDGPSASGRYTLGIDALVLSPSEFKPDGIKKP